MEGHDILVKIPCILACCIGTHVSWLPPAQSGRTEALPPKEWTERYLGMVIPRVWMIRTMWWTLGLTETMAILLRVVNPSSPYLPAGALELETSVITISGAILVAAGGYLRYLCYKTMANHFTFELSIRSKHKLVTHGPYSVVRHPSYAAYIILYAGLALWHGSRGSWVRESGVLETFVGKVVLGIFTTVLLGILYSLLSRVPEEDKKLKEVFGKEWEDYAKRVPYALLPGIL